MALSYMLTVYNVTMLSAALHVLLMFMHCVIRVGSSTVTYHASDIVLSMLSCVIVCYQGWQQHSYIPCTSEAWNVTVLLLPTLITHENTQ